MFGNAVVTASDFGALVLSSRKALRFSTHILAEYIGGALASTTQLSWNKAVNARSFDSELSASPVAVSQRKGIGYLDLRTVSPTSAWLYYYPLVIVTWMFLMLGQCLYPLPSLSNGTACLDLRWDLMQLQSRS